MVECQVTSLGAASAYVARALIACDDASPPDSFDFRGKPHTSAAEHRVFSEFIRVAFAEGCAPLAGAIRMRHSVLQIVCKTLGAMPRILQTIGAHSRDVILPVVDAAPGASLIWCNPVANPAAKGDGRSMTVVPCSVLGAGAVTVHLRPSGRSTAIFGVPSCIDRPLTIRVVGLPLANLLDLADLARRSTGVKLGERLRVAATGTGF